MALSFDRIAKVGMGRECIRLMVRVVRMWTIPMYNNPTQISSLELILVDEHGRKIQATVRKALLYKFSPMLEEGSVYKMVYFNVVPNTGHYRATFHEYKLIFIYKTTVQKKECDLIPMFSFSFVPFNEVMGYNDSYEHLIDVIGVLTTVQPERQYEKDGKITTMVVMELTDPHGKLDCALFGGYVDELRNFAKEGGSCQVIVVVHLARVKTFKGKTVIQNSMNATKLLFNPDIPEAIAFRNSIAEHGIIDVEPISVVLDNSMEGMELDFMKLHPRKSISQLSDLKEDGMFVVLAEIVEIVNDGPWFYLACKCNRSVSLKSGVHFCEECQVPVLEVCPRFKVKVGVMDDTDTAVFVLFDRDVNFLVKLTCEQMLTQCLQDINDDGYPILLATLIGKRILFKVEAKLDKALHFEGSFPVRRVCDDEVIISMFDLAGADLTPQKAIFAPPFPSLSSEVNIEETYTVGSGSIMAPISLEDDDCSIVSKRTTGKRKLDADFDLYNVSCPDSDIKCSGAVEDEDAENDNESVYSLVPVKIEKE